jgi:hypothetical protein
VRRKISVTIARSIAGALLIVAAPIACRDTAWTPRAGAETVLSEIKLGRSADVAKRIDADEGFGRSVMNGIATGDSAWLEVARELSPASATSAASISIALASALPRSPDRVLAVLGRKYPVGDVCDIPFLRPDSSLVTSYYGEAVAALGRVRSAPLVPVRDACRTVLDEARERRLERIDPSYIIKNKPKAPPRRARR